MVRAPYFDENGIKKGAWSPEEDYKLREYIKKHGHRNWREIPKLAGLSRCGKSCRLRWMNYLKPLLKHGNYTKEEEDLILKLHEEHGNKWSLIAGSLPGRTDNEVKNYWHTHLKKRWKKTKNKSELKEHCSETCQSEVSQMNKDLEAENGVLSFFPNLILESSPFSPETSCGEFSNFSSDSAPAGSNWNTQVDDDQDHILHSVETFEESIGDFWTQPFLADNAYYQANNPGLSFPAAPFVSYFDDDIGGVDLYYDYQLFMQEHPRKYIGFGIY